MDSGLGASITNLSQQVDELKGFLETAKRETGASASEMIEMTARAEIAAGRLELLLAALHEDPQDGTIPLRPRAAAAPAVAAAAPVVEPVSEPEVEELPEASEAEDIPSAVETAEVPEPTPQEDSDGLGVEEAVAEPAEEFDETELKLRDIDQELDLEATEETPEVAPAIEDVGEPAKPVADEAQATGRSLGDIVAQARATSGTTASTNETSNEQQDLVQSLQSVFKTG
jgi:hypothetical protein